VKLSLRRWASILEFSCIWGVTEAIKVITEQMDGLNSQAFQNVDVGREFSIRHFLRKGYLQFVRNEGVLGEREVSRFGLETIIQIYCARELRYPQVTGTAHTGSWGRSRGLPQNVEKYLSDIVPASPDPSDPVKRILAANEHSLPDVLRYACEELAKRKEPLTVDEGKLLGKHVVLKILPARLCTFQNCFQGSVYPNGREGSSGEAKLEDAENVVDRVFAKEFALCRF
jgi:hypothetical protein